MDVSELKKQLSETVDNWLQYQRDEGILPPEGEKDIEPTPPRTDGKRAVRTKSTGDRVYLIDDNAKTKAWITSPEIMSGLGFEMSDVEDVDDGELTAYAMSPSIYKVDA